MKAKLFAIGVLYSMLFVLVQPVFASSASWWHGLSQTSRNNHILSRAFDELGDVTGQSCKEWVRTVVKDASENTVTIPSTKSNKYQWYSHTYVQGFGHPTPISWAAPGSIIQMKWAIPGQASTPHTAIVVSHTGSGMYWIDCNWEYDKKVRVHYISYSLFAQRAGSYYTIYYIK